MDEARILSYPPGPVAFRHGTKTIHIEPSPLKKLRRKTPNFVIVIGIILFFVITVLYEKELSNAFDFLRPFPKPSLPWLLLGIVALVLLIVGFKSLSAPRLFIDKNELVYGRIGFRRRRGFEDVVALQLISGAGERILMGPSGRDTSRATMRLMR